MENSKVIGFGEVLWDILPEQKHLGGAPANVAFHCQQFGVSSCIVSAIGNDALGSELLNTLEQKNVNFDLQKSDLPTGSVLVDMKNGIPSYTIVEPVAWDDIKISDSILAEVKNTNAICFGSLAQRNETTRSTLYDMLNHSSPTTIKVFDMNIRKPFINKEWLERSLQFATTLKINDEELELMVDMFDLSRDTEEAILRLMMQTFNLQYLAFTKGAEGSYLLHKNEMSFLPRMEVEAIDTIGAGDSFTAALTTGILQNLPLKEIHSQCNKLAAYVCTQEGAMPEWKGKLQL